MRWEMFVNGLFKPLTLEIGMMDMFCSRSGCSKRRIWILGIVIRRIVSITNDLRLRGISSGQMIGVNIIGLA